MALSVFAVSASAARAAAVAWPQLERTNAGTGNNPFETAITPTAARRLQPIWRLSAPATAALGPPIASKTTLFVPGKTIYALNPRNGAVVWKRASRTAVTPGLALANGVLYEVGRAGPNGVNGPTRGVLYARSAATGRVLWSAHSALGQSSVFYHAYQGSPTVSSGIVYFGEVNTTTATTTNWVDAYNVRTHLRVWRRGLGGSGSKPLVSAGLVYGLGYDSDRNGWDIATWTAAHGNDGPRYGVQPGQRFAVNSSRLFYGGEGGIWAFRAGCDGAPCGLQWSRQTVFNEVTTLALASDRVIAATWTGPNQINPAPLVQALALDTGRVIWQAPATAGYPAGVSLAGGVVYVAGSDELDAYPLRCSTPCQPLWRHKVDTYGPATIVNGRVFVTGAGGNRVFAFAPR